MSLLAGPSGAVEQLTTRDTSHWFQCSFDVGAGLGSDNVLRILVSSKGGRPADAAGPIYLEGYVALRTFAIASSGHKICCQLFEQRGKLKRRSSGSGKRGRKGAGAATTIQGAGAGGENSVQGDTALFSWLDEQRHILCGKADPDIEVAMHRKMTLISSSCC